MGTRHIARRVLHFRGIWATIYRESGGTFDPETSSVTGETTTTVRAKGKLSNFNLDEIDGTEVQSDDRRFMAPSMDFEGEGSFLPRAGDEIIFDADLDTKFRIHKVRVFDADKAIMLQLRGGGVMSPAAGASAPDQS